MIKDNLITARITPTAYNYLSSKNFKNKQQAISECINLAMTLDSTDAEGIKNELATLKQLRALSVLSITGMFTYAELSYLFDVLARIERTPAIKVSKQVLITQIEVSNALFGLEQIHQIDSPALLSKIDRMEFYHLYALHCIYDAFSVVCEHDVISRIAAPNGDENTQ
jgi:hypothetical protein